MAVSRRMRDVDYFNDETNLGSYQRVSLDDVINNFIIAYIGDGKTLVKVPRYEVAFHAQRALQEFSYDILRAEKHLEIEMNPDTMSIPMPADYVDYVKLSFLDSQGNDIPMFPRRLNNYKQVPLQDRNYDYLYDANGDIIYDDTDGSEEQDRFQDRDLPFRGVDFAQTEYYNYYYDDDYSYYYNSYYGRRFGRNPEFSNRNPSFIVDDHAGRIYFDWKLDDLTSALYVNLRYISDGIAENDDFSQVFVHKFIEEALYSYLLYNLSKVRPSAAGAAALYQKEMSSKMRNAKIRLTRWNQEELTQIMRGRAKWIKH